MDNPRQQSGAEGILVPLLFIGTLMAVSFGLGVVVGFVIRMAVG